MDSAATALRREDAFLLCCVRAFADGRVDPEENDVLRALVAALDLDPSRAHVIAGAARQAGRRGRLPSAGALRTGDTFRALCRRAARDGEIDAGEREVLRAAARALGVAPARVEDLIDGALSPGDLPPAGTVPGGASTFRERLGLFLKAPRYYLEKMLSRESRDRQARRILAGIQDLVARAPHPAALASVVARAEGLARRVFEIEAQHDALERFLEGRAFLMAPARGGDSDRVGTIPALHARRAELGRTLDHLLEGLRRIEERVASLVLAGGGGAAGARDLREVLEDLEALQAVA